MGLQRVGHDWETEQHLSLRVELWAGAGLVGSSQGTWRRAGQGAGRSLGLVDAHWALAFGLWLLGRCLPFDLLTLQQAVVDLFCLQNCFFTLHALCLCCIVFLSLSLDFCISSWAPWWEAVCRLTSLKTLRTSLCGNELFTIENAPGTPWEIDGDLPAPGCCTICCLVTSVMSNSVSLYGLPPTRLLCPWDSPGKNTRAGCHALLQGIFLTQGFFCAAGRIFTCGATTEAQVCYQFISIIKNQASE